MKKYISIILFVSFIFVAFSITKTNETLNNKTKLIQSETFELNQDLEIQENENQPLLNLGFLGGLGGIIGGLIGGGGSTPQPPVYPPPPPPAPAPPQNNNNSESKDSGLMPMLIVMVVAILAFFGLKK